MTQVSKPETTFQIVGASSGSPDTPQKVLFVGQQGSGTAVTGVLVEKIDITGGEDALFGPNSDLAGMIRTARRYNTETRFDAIPLDDAGGADPAEGIVAITGPATAAGTLDVVIGSRENHTFTIAVADTDTATIIGDALVTAITTDGDAPFSAANVTGTVTITASNGGTVGNFYGLEFNGTVAGVSVVLTAFTGGATDPVLTNLFDVIDGERYQTIVWPSTFDVDTVRDFLDGRFNATNEILDGVAVMSVTDTLANIDTLASGHNSQSLVIHGNALVNDTLYKGSAISELDNNIAATVGALRALRLTEDATIADIVIASGGLLDAVGGPAAASLPYHNTPTKFLPAIDAAKGFNTAEVDQLNTAGAFVIGNNPARTAMIIGTVVTTFKTDSAGNPDPSFVHLNQVDTMSVIREQFATRLRARFAQYRLTDGKVQPGRSMANQVIIEGELDRIYNLLSGTGFVLTRAGPVPTAFFKNNRTVVLDLEDGSVTITAKVPIVTQLREINGVLQIQFNLNG